MGACDPTTTDRYIISAATFSQWYRNTAGVNSGQKAVSNWGTVADAQGVIMVYPNGKLGIVTKTN